MSQIMPEDYLLLDSAIRDWVVFPIVVMLIFVGIGRHYVQELIKSQPKVTKEGLDEIRYKQVLMQSQRIRTSGQYLNERAFNVRKSYLLRKKTGILRERVPGPTNPMSNPMAMVDMMKGNLTFMLPNIAMMTFVGYFFSGFICLKVPFPMPSNHFRLMLQRGVDLSTLNISYVSSLSWYFMVTFGLNGVYSLLIGGDHNLLNENMQMQMGMGMGMMGGGQQAGFDAKSAYAQEREALAVFKHEWELDNVRKINIYLLSLAFMIPFTAFVVERRLLGDRYPDPSAQLVDLSRLVAKWSLATVHHQIALLFNHTLIHRLERRKC